MEQSPAEQLVGAVFSGRYRLMRLVGEGGMGAVYEARVMNAQQPGPRGNDGVVALKVLHPEFSSEDQIVQRFFAEAQACQMLQHANVAQIFEAARAEDGTPYLVMEMLSGMPLSNFMKPGQPVPPQQTATIAWGVLQALAVAHQKGIVHRDLKPDNLFLVPDGRGNFVVKVLDFGIAKVMDLAGGMGSKTKTGVLLGTPGYMSPEQIKNSKGVDARSDLWGVGIIMYEMLTGREAFTADNEFARLTAVLTQDITPVAQVLPALAAWTPFFQRALAKDPNQRFQSASEMAQAVTSTAQSGKSNQGRDWGTVVLSIPQPPPGAAAYPAGPPTPPPGHGVASAHRPSQPTPQPGYGGAPSYAQSGYPASGYPSASPHASVPTHVGANAPHAMAPVPASASPNAPEGVYRVAAQQNPSTHVSLQRPPGVGTIASSVPDIAVVAPRPIGYPLWLVVAAGAAGLAIGLVIGILL